MIPLQRGVETGLRHKEHVIFIYFHLPGDLLKGGTVVIALLFLFQILLNVFQIHIWKFYLAALTWVEPNLIPNQANGSLQ